jgi:single-strand DNA-binding protein
MANQIQRLEYEGYLVEDPEMRYTPSGKSVTNFRIGSNRQYKNAAGETIKETTWLKVTAWGKLGEIVHDYCAKGSHVVVFGILRVGENGSPQVYALKNGGSGASYEVTANEVRILKGKDKVEGEPVSESVDESDIPF